MLDVYVQPGASASGFAGTHDGRPKLRIASPPVDGRANRELCRFLAAELGLAKSAVRVVAGETSRSKRLCLRLEGGPPDLARRLQQLTRG